MTYIQRLCASFYFLLLAMFNFCLAHAPFFFLRRLLLCSLGWRIGKQVAIHRGIKITSLKSPCIIGDRTVVNTNVLLDNRRGIAIGSDVSISQWVKIYTLGHDINEPDFCSKGSSVNISNYSVLFSGAVIMPGVSIGIGAVVLPFSVLTHSIPEFSVFGGCPAIKKADRSRDVSYRLDYRVWFGI